MIMQRKMSRNIIAAVGAERVTGTIKSKESETRERERLAPAAEAITF